MRKFRCVSNWITVYLQDWRKPWLLAAHPALATEPGRGCACEPCPRHRCDFVDIVVIPLCFVSWANSCTQSEKKTLRLLWPRSRKPKTNLSEGNFMKKKIAWLFLFVMGFAAVPVFHAPAVSRVLWTFDGTQPTPEPPPYPVW